MFLLKKWLSVFFLPLPMVLLLLLIGLILLFAKKRGGRVFVLLAFLILLILSEPWLANMLVRPLETQYPALMTPPADIDYIVVLGGGLRNTTDGPANTILQSNSLARLVEGIRLYRLCPHSQLVVSGGGFIGHPELPTVASTMAATAISLGVDPARIIQENTSLDTADEARLLTPLLLHHRFILVTSASHIPRSMQLFEAAGLQPTAAPSNYYFDAPSNTLDFIPSTANIAITAAALHEYAGSLWAHVKHTTHEKTP